MNIIRSLLVASAAFFIACSAYAQNPGTVTNHAVAVGKGAGKQGFTSVGPCTTAYSLVFAGASADPACGQIDLTAGVTGTLPPANGGTGQTTVLAALQAWGLQVPNLTHKAAPVGADKIGFYDVAGSAYKYATLTELLAAVVSGVSSVNGQTGAIAAYFPPQGRITLVSGTPVMTTSQSAATTVYYTPSAGDMVPLYDGTNIVPTVFAEQSIALGSNWAANSNYDVFIALDTGPTLRACTGPAWTSDTARGTGAGTTELNITKGLYLNNVSITCRYNNTTTFTVAASRGTYVGTIRTGASTGIVNYIFGTTVANWGAGDFGVWNAYNRVYVSSTTGEATSGGWTYTVANTWRAANGNATARISFIRGLDQDIVVGTYSGATNPGSGTVTAIGVGLDTTTALTPASRNQFSNLTCNAIPMVARYSGYPGLGRHYLSANEIQNTTTSDRKSVV